MKVVCGDGRLFTTRPKAQVPPYLSPNKRRWGEEEHLRSVGGGKEIEDRRCCCCCARKTSSIHLPFGIIYTLLIVIAGIDNNNTWGEEWKLNEMDPSIRLLRGFSSFLFLFFFLFFLFLNNNERTYIQIIISISSAWARGENVSSGRTLRNDI